MIFKGLWLVFMHTQRGQFEMSMTTFREWVRVGKERGASDLHIEAGTPLVMRIRGELAPASEPISPELVLQIARELLDKTQWQDFLARRSADLSLTTSGTRCRINVFQTVRGIGLAVRLLSSFQSTIRDCNLHPDLRKFLEPRAGLVVISGATGSGKSTTLAAMIEEINAVQARNVITIESPIEYFFTNRKSFIRQREVPSHTPSFEQAIVDSMRENPDVLVIGEMRTPDVMRLTLNAAETGHLVLATMHSSTCAEALARICMSFPAEIQGSIRAQLADCLVGVVCQRLDFLPQAQLRVPHLEILHASSAAKSNLRSGQFSQIASVLQSGGEDGMWSFERYERWMNDKKDWVRPTQARPLEERQRPAPGPALGSVARPAALAQARPAARALDMDTPPTDGRIVIPTADDVEDLGELVRKISEEDE